MRAGLPAGRLALLEGRLGPLLVVGAGFALLLRAAPSRGSARCGLSREAPVDPLGLRARRRRGGCPAALAYRPNSPPLAAWGRDPRAWRRGLEDLRIDWVVYRADLAPEKPLLADLGDGLERVAGNGPAILYRVRR
jgi:hypothetical protein